MAETTADVRRDIELTRERLSSTLAQLEQKLNLGQAVKDHPWPALGMAFGAGLLLSGSRADVKAAAAAAVASKGASSKLGNALDDIVANLMQSVGEVLQGHVDTLVGEVKQALGARGDGQRSGFASYSGSVTSAPQLADTDTHPASGFGSPAAGQIAGQSAGWNSRSAGTVSRAD
jgi:Protein of unknown function (DUF3618)